jgi:uncharacterized repeat protein (TIGR03803 family)
LRWLAAGMGLFEARFACDWGSLMKLYFLVLLASIALLFGNINPAKASTDGYQVLYSFAGKKGGSGATPHGRMILLDGWLYGTTSSGGQHDGGVIFKFNPTTSQYVTLYSFGNVSGGSKPSKKYGCYPEGGLTLFSTNVVAGAASECGPALGNIFSFDVTSNTIASLHNFVGGRNGSFPGPELLSDNSILFGLTTSGTVFSLSPITRNFTRLHVLNGASPSAALVEGADGMLYGSTQVSGSKNCPLGCGTLFLINPDTSNFLRLYDFRDGKDGASPTVAMSADGHGHLYGGTTEIEGGTGSIFRINDGTTNGGGLGFSTVYVFTNDDAGKYLGGELVLDPISGAFYGVSDTDGAGVDYGAVFKFDPTSNALTVLHTFPVGTKKDGGHPGAGLTPDGNGSYFGTTTSGGSYGYGVIFKITPS